MPHPDKLRPVVRPTLRKTTRTTPDPDDKVAEFVRVATGGTTDKRGLLRFFGTTAKVIAGATAGKVIGDRIGPRQPEIGEQIDPTAHFIGSTHAEGQEAHDLAQRLLFYADPDAISWTDPKLPYYIAHYQPSVLTVDMNSLSRPDDPLETTDIWSSIPRVSKIKPQSNYQGKTGVFVISGDNSYRGMAGEPNNSALGLRLDAAFDQDRQRAKAERRHNLYNWNNASSLSLAISGLIGAGAAILKDTKQGFPRRSVLAAGAIGGIALATGSTEVLYKAINRIPNPVWLRGRTAVATAKDMDGKAYLIEQNLLDRNAQSVILMGTGHAADSKLLMSNKPERDKAILELALHARDEIQTAIREQFPDTSDAEMAKVIQDAMLNFASMDIHFVSDPGILEGVVQLKEEYIDPNVHTVARKVVSPQVYEVLQNGGLLPPVHS